MTQLATIYGHVSRHVGRTYHRELNFDRDDGFSFTISCHVDLQAPGTPQPIVTRSAKRWVTCNPDDEDAWSDYEYANNEPLTDEEQKLVDEFYEACKRDGFEVTA